MTVIVGLEHEGSVFIGGDSAGVAGYGLTVRADEKVFVNGPFIFGFTSSFRMGQLLRYSFEPPYHRSDIGDEKFLSTVFIDAVRKCFRDGGFSRKFNEVESAGTFLCGYRGKLYSIEDDYQVGRSVQPYHAVGCGDQIALGAMYASFEILAEADPEYRMDIALEAAEQNSAGVRGPFTILRGGAK